MSGRSKNGGLCKGADANRNYGFHFDDGGSSDSACSDTYHGSKAFSEVENQVNEVKFERPLDFPSLKTIINLISVLATRNLQLIGWEPGPDYVK